MQTLTANPFETAQRNHDRAEPSSFGPSEERVQEIAADLIRAGGECDPTDSMNFAEAISDASDTDLRRVAAFVRDDEHVQACAAMKRIATEYWREKAYAKASDIAEAEFFQGEQKRSVLAHYRAELAKLEGGAV